jgi:AraC-like DNA-binding protein
MGYGGKVTERHRARELRAEAWTLKDIAAELGVSKSSVSLWVRDVDFVPTRDVERARRGPAASSSASSPRSTVWTPREPRRSVE